MKAMAAGGRRILGEGRWLKQWRHYGAITGMGEGRWLTMKDAGR
jgi:hypothetical protein